MSSSGGMESFYDIGGDIETESQISSDNNNGSSRISYNDIASKLIRDRLLLTALELHSELLEAGKEIPKLRDFFSNPGNFEFQGRTELSPTIPRSSSQATLDSLDFTRLSEDGERASEDRVAVLEFELRKANEKINALRANLTSAAECETPTSDVNDGSKSFLNDPIKPHEQRALNFLINEYLLIKGYKLTSITFSDQNEDQDFEDWDDVGLNIPKPAGLLQLFRLGLKYVSSTNTADSYAQTGDPFVDFEAHLIVVEENKDLKEKLLISQKEKMELVIDYENEVKEGVTTCSTACQMDKCDLVNVESQTDPSPVSPPPLTAQAVCQLEEAVNDLKNLSIASGFEKEVCKEVGILDDWYGLNSISTEMLIQTLPQLLINIATTLPLNNKEWMKDVIHLLVHLILLNPDTKQRDRLMQCLLSLKKRPQDEDRQLILSGLVRIARSKDSEELIEAHLLPQCWELMNNKYLEKRLLVVEICSQIALFLPGELRNSLLVSILQQMVLEDKEEAVKVASVKSLSLIAAFIDSNDDSKYQQIQELMLKVICDPSSRVVEICCRMLLPVVARWSLTTVDSERFPHLLSSLISLSISQLQSTGGVKFTGIVALTTLLPHLVMFVASDHEILATASSELPPPQPRASFSSLCSGLSSPVLFYRPQGEETVNTVMRAFDNCVKQKQPPYQTPRLILLLESLLPQFIDLINYIEASQEDCILCFVKFFKNFCAGFGTSVAFEVKEKMLKLWDTISQKLIDNPDSSSISLSFIPVYFLSIIIPQQVSNREEVSETLERFLTNVATSGASSTSLIMTFVQSAKSSQDLVEPIMAAIWKGVVHKRSDVKVTSGSLLSSVVPECTDQVITTRVVPALITLASDAEVSVRVAAVSAFGSVIKHTTTRQALDKVYLQVQSVVTDPGLVNDESSLVTVTSALGAIASHCEQPFREEVVLPGLGRMVDILKNDNIKFEVRRSLCETLVEAYSNTIYCHISPVVISTSLIPYMRNLVSACNELLPSHAETVVHMEKELESRNSPSTPMSKSSSNMSLTSLSSPNVEEMKQKVTKMFTSPMSKTSNLPNIPNLFKKK